MRSRITLIYPINAIILTISLTILVACGGESDSDSGLSEALIDAAPEVSVSHQRWDDIGSEAAWDGNTTMIRYGNVTVEFSGKTYDRAEGEDWVAPDIAQAVARAIVANLDEAG